MKVRCGKDKFGDDQWWSAELPDLQWVRTVQLINRYSDNVYTELLRYVIKDVDERSLGRLRFTPLIDGECNEKDSSHHRGSNSDPRPFVVRNNPMGQIRLTCGYINNDRGKFVTTWDGNTLTKWDKNWLVDAFQGPFSRLDLHMILDKVKLEAKKDLLRHAKQEVKSLRAKLNIVNKLTLTKVERGEQ